MFSVTILVACCSWDNCKYLNSNWPQRNTLWPVIKGSTSLKGGCKCLVLIGMCVRMGVDVYRLWIKLSCLCLCTQVYKRKVILWDSNCILWSCLNFVHDFESELIFFQLPHLQESFQRVLLACTYFLCLMKWRSKRYFCKSNFKFFLCFMCSVNE